MFDDEIIIDLSSLNDSYDLKETVRFQGEGSAFQVLSSVIKNSQGLGDVASVIFEADCSLADCSVVRFFPNLKGVLIAGKTINSLSGIDAFASLDSLVIKPPVDVDFDFSALLGVEVWSLHLWGVSEVSVKQFVGMIDKLERLVLHEPLVSDYAGLCGKGLKELEIIGAKHRQLKSLSNVSCDSIRLFKCGKLLGFDDISSLSLKSLVIESCASFHFDEIIKIKKCENLRVVNIRSSVSLSLLLDIPGLQNLALQKVNVDFEGLKLKSRIGHDLETVVISPFQKHQMERLAKLYPRINWQS